MASGPDPDFEDYQKVTYFARMMEASRLTPPVVPRNPAIKTANIVDFHNLAVVFDCADQVIFWKME
jgi:hypothetical protein